MLIKGTDEKQSIPMFLNYLATILFFVWALSPYFLRNTSISIVSLIIALWFISAFIQIVVGKKSGKGLGVIIGIILWQLWEYSLRLLGYSTAAWGNYYSKTLFWFSMIIFIFHSIYSTEKAREKIGKYILIIYLINLIDNLRLTVLYPTSSSDINYSWGSKYLEMNVGGTMFSAVTLFVFCITLALLRNQTKRGIKFLFVFISILEFFYLYYCARSTALVLAVIAIAFNIIHSSSIYAKHKFIVNLFAILGIPILLFFIIPYILELINNITSITKISDRISDLDKFISGQSNSLQVEDSSLLMRIRLAEISLSTFFSSIKNFFLGVGNRIFIAYNISFQSGVGGHSEFIDMLAKYGLIGSVFIFGILKSFFKLSISSLKEKPFYNNLKIVVIIYILYSFLNNSFSPELGVIVFVFLPYSQFLFDSSNKDKKVNLLN